MSKVENVYNQAKPARQSNIKKGKNMKGRWKRIFKGRTALRVHVKNKFQNENSIFNGFSEINFSLKVI